MFTYTDDGTAQGNNVPLVTKAVNDRHRTTPELRLLSTLQSVFYLNLDHLHGGLRSLAQQMPKDTRVGLKKIGDPFIKQRPLC